MKTKSKYFVFAFFVCCLGFGLSQPLWAKAAKEKSAAKRPAAEKPSAVNVAVLNGPSGMCFAKMFDSVPQIDGVAASYEVCAGPDVLLPKLLKGELDIGVLPPNAAAKVYNANNGAIVMAGVSGYGMLHLVTADSSVKSLADLRGKTVSVAGQGATPEYMLRYLLASQNIPVDTGAADSVTLDFSIPSSELAAALLSGKTSCALMPEPFVTVAMSKSGGAKTLYKAIDVQAEWNKLQKGGESFPMTVIVVRREFAEKHPQTLRAFIAEAKAAIEWTNANAAEAAALVEKHTLGLNAQVAAAAIPNSAFAFGGAKQSRAAVEKLLSVFAEYAPQSVGGKLPDDGFYFE